NFRKEVRYFGRSMMSGNLLIGLDEDDTRYPLALRMKDLEEEGCFLWLLGGRTQLGQYRKGPISVRSSPHRIFPYHVEVPAWMRRFFQWREKTHQGRKLRPLTLACQTVEYFLHIHPFPDGNGRVSRMIMHDYMVRQGYVPVIMQALERQDYLRMISDAQDG